MKLSPCIHQFFDHYLPHIKGVSSMTIRSYRDTFRLFLPFAAQYHTVKVKSLRLEHITWELVIAFLDDLQHKRKNIAKTRNQRLAAIKSFSKMMRLFYPEYREIANRILDIPHKRARKLLIGFLYYEEILQVFNCVDLKKPEGFRDYTLLHTLFDSGARASEICTLNIDYFNPHQQTLVILGKGNRFRLIPIKNKTIQLLQLYISKYRVTPKPPFQHRIFISQRGKELTRHGIYRICKKYLNKALPEKRLKTIRPVHSFRHSRAVDLLYQGKDITEIKNFLGHDNIQSTTVYLQLDLNRKKHIQKQLMKHMESILSLDPKITEWLDHQKDIDIMKWLDTI
jgi:site-specific recombinase XerD